MSKSDHILWLDLEMTGLDPSGDLIVEVAAIVTDWNFREIATFDSGVGQDPAVLKERFDRSPFYKKFPENRRKLTALSHESPPVTAVESQFVSFVEQHCDTHYPVLMAGNSIHMDRQFIRAQLPRLEQLLHYRMLDVSAWKVVFEGKFGKKFVKSENHRALSDVEESIAELKFYLSHLDMKELS